MADVNLRAPLFRVFFLFFLLQTVYNYHLIKTSTTFESPYTTFKSSSAAYEMYFGSNPATSCYEFFYTFRHRTRRPITKWSPNGQTFIAAPERRLQIDITIFMDVEVNPGPQEEQPTPSKLGSDLPGGLKITQWNMQSVAPSQNNSKLDELRLLLKNPGLETHILAITESWLSKNYKNSHLKIPGYNFERVDRGVKELPVNKTTGGGIIIYIKQDLIYKRRTDLESKDIECVWIELCPPKRPKHLLCTAYRNPDYDLKQWLENFETHITNAFLEGHQLSLMGDFNIDLFSNTSNAKEWLDFTSTFQLTQLIKEPTRVTATTSTLIFFTTHANKVRAVKVAKIGTSDHFPICAVFKSSFGLKNHHTSITYRSYKDFDQKAFLEDLQQCPWHQLDDLNHVDETLDKWYELFNNVINKHLPLKNKRVKNIQQPDWMTDEIILNMKQRDTYKANGNFNMYKSSRNHCVKLIREAKQNYFKTCITNSRNDSSKLWKHLNTLAPKEAKSSPTLLKVHDKTLTKPSDISNYLSNHFATIVNQYLPPECKDPDFSKLKEFIASKLPTDNIKLSMPPVNKDYVLKSLANLVSHKATGLDGITSKILKISAPVISSHLTTIFNQSIESGIFPSQWKTARITPVFKSGDHSNADNYRPISILPIISKLLERHIHKHIYNFISSHDLLFAAQSGFRPQHSCESALNKLLNTWHQNIENGFLNGLVLIDFRKAFDMINLDLLLEKLKLYHFDTSLLKWMDSYLKERSHCVKVKDSISSPTPISHGVPQGSIIGPLLFILFINDLPLSTSLNIDMYADDSTLYTRGTSVDELSDKLTMALGNVQNWCLSNGMIINIKKTKTMTISTYQKESKIGCTDLKVHYDNKLLDSVPHEKLLGVTIDKHLLWKEHINTVTSTLSKNLALLRRIRTYLPTNIRILYYKVYFQPIIDYCNTIWGQSSHITRILKLQKLALRLIYDKPWDSPSFPLFEKAKLLPIDYRVNLRLTLMTYKAVNGLVPKYISNLFKFKNTVSQRVTRSTQNNELYVPNNKLNLTRNGLAYSGALLYNILPSNIRNTKCLATFKKELYKYFLEMYSIAN